MTEKRTLCAGCGSDLHLFKGVMTCWTPGCGGNVWRNASLGAQKRPSRGLAAFFGTPIGWIRLVASKGRSTKSSPKRENRLAVQLRALHEGTVTIEQVAETMRITQEEVRGLYKFWRAKQGLYAQGGYIPKPADYSERIPVYLHPAEHRISPEAARKLGSGILENLNQAIEETKPYTPKCGCLHCKALGKRCGLCDAYGCA